MSTTVRHDKLEVAFKVHEVGTVLDGLDGKRKMSSSNYYRSHNAAIMRCEELLREDPSKSFYIFKTVSLVRSKTPPIEVIHHEE